MLDNLVPKPRKTFLATVMAVAALAFVAMPDGIPAFSVPAAHAAEGIRIPAPKAAVKEPARLQVAVFAGGCFWGIEGVFEHTKGVTRAESGYAGGSKAKAVYNLVSGGRTRHAEAVRVVYNPKKVSYNQLLHIFFSVAHDPTQLNRQGPDRGRHYRSAIFPVTAAQSSAARAYIKQLSAKSPWGRRIVTRIESGRFYPAEKYHQNYMKKNPNSPYIRTYDAPKLVNLKRLFPRAYR